MEGNIEFVRLWIVLAAVLIAAVTTGEYYFRRRKMKRFDFSVWRERRLTCVGLLAGTWYLLPDVLKQGNVFLASLLDR